MTRKLHSKPSRIPAGQDVLARLLAVGLLIMPAGITATSAQDASEMTIAPDQIFSVTTGDWNKDGAQDAVIMIETPEQEFDVLFYLTDEDRRLKLHDHVKEMVWGASAMFGQEPSVTTRENGAILISSQNSAIGRNRWEEKLTVVYRKNRFIVAGFSYSHYDTLDPDTNGECDLNLLTGKGTLNGGTIRFERQPVSVQDFAGQSDEWRALCGEPQ
jgi:hypothetical protein